MAADIVQYETFTEEDAAALDREASAVGGSPFHELAEGDNVHRFLPGRMGERPYLVDYKHFVSGLPGMDEKDFFSFSCPKLVAKGKCEVCDFLTSATGSGNRIDRKVLDDLKPRVQVYANSLDRLNPDAGVKTLRFGKQIQKQLTTIRKNPRTGGEFTHPLKGFDIVIVRNGSGKNTEYLVSAARDFTPLAEPIELIQELINTQPRLDNYIDTKIPDELLSILAMYQRAQSARSGGTSSDTRAQRPAARTSTASAASVVEDVMEGDFEDEDDGFYGGVD